VRSPQRLVSLAPSITEVLFELGLGQRLVGVTSFCDYPPEALTKPKVGGLLDPNPEAIVAAKPDLVILFDHHTAALDSLRALGVACLTVQGDTMEQVLASVGTIATACGAAERGTALTVALRARVAAVARRPRPQPVPRVLVSVGRTLGAGRLQDVYVAGEDGFFSELIGLAGGCNACPEKTIRFPLVSSEGLLEMRPDVVIELAADLERLSLAPADVVREWAQIPELPAVRLGQVHVLTEDYVTVPGPRFVLLLEKMADVIAVAQATRPGAAPEARQ
jgi:iron complex transport system substrate-binding protein